MVLPGPAGEQNEYSLAPRGQVAALSETVDGLLDQVAALLATGNVAVVERRHPARGALDGLPPALAACVVFAEDWLTAPGLRGVLVEGNVNRLLEVLGLAAARSGAILMVQRQGAAGYALEWLLEERLVSTNTAAAGGNAALMALT